MGVTHQQTELVGKPFLPMGSLNSKPLHGTSAASYIDLYMARWNERHIFGQIFQRLSYTTQQIQKKFHIPKVIWIIWAL